MPLAMLGCGEKAFIKEFRTKDKIKSHLQNIGFVLGEEVSIISETDGNLILKIKDGRIAIDKSMALKIVVEKIA
jgi:ferrous iron transport protein A